MGHSFLLVFPRGCSKRNGNRKARMWVGPIEICAGNLGAHSRRSPPIPSLPDLPILVKASVVSEAVRKNGAA
jgi:hypothetical protein